MHSCQLHCFDLDMKQQLLHLKVFEIKKTEKNPI